MDGPVKRRTQLYEVPKRQWRTDDGYFGRVDFA